MTRHWWERHVDWLRASPAVSSIAVACVLIFVVQLVTMRLEFPQHARLGNILTYTFGLYWPLLAKGCFWQPISYAFLHGSWLHLLLNMFTLVFFGPAVESLVGTRRFLGIYLLSAIIGGLGWMLFNWLEPSFWLGLQHLPGDFWINLTQRWAEKQPLGEFGVCIGASGAVFGLIGGYAAMAPERRLMILLFFVIPLRLSARKLAVLLMVVTVVQLIVGWGQVAYAAHLIGGLAGFMMGRRWVRKYPITYA